MSKRERQDTETRIAQLQTEAHHEERISAVMELRKTIKTLQAKLYWAGVR